MSEHHTIDCGRHGKSRLIYFVCVHVRDGAWPAYLKFCDDNGPGEAICADCQAKGDVDLDDARVVCEACFSEIQKPNAN